MNRDHTRHVGYNSLATGVLVLTTFALEGRLDLAHVWHASYFLSQIRFPFQMLEPRPTPVLSMTNEEPQIDRLETFQVHVRQHGRENLTLLLSTPSSQIGLLRLHLV